MMRLEWTDTHAGGYEVIVRCPHPDPRQIVSMLQESARKLQYLIDHPEEDRNVKQYLHKE